jgi:anti-anti-sigma factor
MSSLETSAFRVSRADTDHPVVVAVAGELDLETAPEVWDVLAHALEDGGLVAIDLSGVTFMDSQGLNLLVRAHKRATFNGGRLVLRAPRPQARKVLQLTKLDEVFEIED